MHINFKRISFGYSRDSTVFNDVTLELSHFPVAVLGPNGAGKSTLLALLAGRLTPQRGIVEVLGEPGQTARGARGLRALTSWMPQDTKPVRGFSVREYVAYAGWLKGMRYRDAWKAARHAAQTVDLQDRQRVPVTALSGGQRRRLGIASALVSTPSVLILDEPYAGLDPDQRGAVRDTLRELRGSTALVVSTHQTEDLDDIYGGVLVIDNGQVLFNGSTREFVAGIPANVPQSERAEYAYRRVTRDAATRIQ
ncbi:ATP-binding cassette domain-containing protein [Microbacterium sp. NPDC008134]|uniref:ATP-binding cassette domain-containing protein n=1 Tax=Microbacterium sp. NPDC008134 TaxID=3364183 RepID=UPI0036ED37D5